MKTLVVKNANKSPFLKNRSAGQRTEIRVCRVLSLLLISVLLGALVILFSGCDRTNVFIPKEYETDKYGYQRPKGMWISDVLALPGMLSLENMFGESGESGIISSYAKEKDGTLNPEGTSYLVALCYGKPDAGYLKTYLRFTMVNDDGVYYDGDCVETGEPLLYGIPLESFDMSAEPNERLKIKCSGERMQGAVVIPFTVKEGMQGVLSTYCVIEPENDTTERYVDERSIVQIGVPADNELVHVDNISTGYVNADEWNGGDFSSEAVSDTPDFENGDSCYMIMDVAYTSQKFVIGKRALGISVNLFDDTGAGVSLERTPTDFSERTYDSGLLHLESECELPAVNRRQRVERVILRLDSEEVISHSLGLFFYGNDGVVPSGLTYVDNAFSAKSFGSLDFAPLHQDKEPVPRWIAVLIMAIISIVIIIVATSFLYVACGNLIVEWYSIMPIVFAIESSLLAILSLSLFTSLPWWMVAIAELCVIGASMVSAFITYSSGETFSPIFTFVAYAVTVVPAISAWRWWVVLFAAAVFMIVDYIIGSFTFDYNKEASCYLDYTPTILTMLTGIALIIFLPAAWWVVMIIELGVIILIRLLVSAWSRSRLVD